MKNSSDQLFQFDQFFINSHSNPKPFLIGIDEAGRGPLAGPVVAAAVLLPNPFFDPFLNDSKKISPKKRLISYQNITKNAYWSIGVSSAQRIDSINILQATYFAMKSALNTLLRRIPSIQKNAIILVDGYPIPNLTYPQKNIFQGDGKSACIAAASIVAKVWRDKMMIASNKYFPNYRFSQHKGYGTSLHLKNLKQFGPSIFHRKSFSPVNKLLKMIK